MTSGLAARRIEALSHDEVPNRNLIYLIYLISCLAARRIEALSHDEVIRMLGHVLAAMFDDKYGRAGTREY